ncbi:hypothetical protein [Streptomyces cellulosae]|uniref:hypothetical protein n=1 Tax=Streptomyces cellulosae TaxID=1968 RepID=UPI0004CA919F|nr:hypothetical protein [Streptomyces cellulosae]
MKITVGTHKIPGYGPTLRTTRRMTEQAVRIVSRAVPGSMPDLEVILTNPRGMAELAAAASAELAGVLDKRTRAKAEREALREARDVSGRAIPRADGSALVLLNVDQHPGEAEMAVTLVHELVHCMQFSRKNVVERIVRDTRDGFRVERQSRRQAREYDRAVEQDEREAYGKEYLANQLVPGAAA